MITETLDRLLHAFMFRECTCYCQVCACKEFVKVFAKKCKIKCPVCQREADRIVVKNAADDERVSSLRRCKSAMIVREKLEEEILGMHKDVIPVKRESSDQTVDGLKPNEQKDLVKRRYNETMCACEKLEEITSADHRAEVPSRQESPSQAVVKRGQNMLRSLTLRRYVEALSAFKKLVDAFSNDCGAEVQLQQESSNRTVAKDGQRMQNYSMLGLCEEAMVALTKMAEELLGNCDAGIPGHRDSTSKTVTEGNQNTQRGKLTKDTGEKVEAAFDKLYDATVAYITDDTPVQEAPSDQTVVKNTWTLRQVPLLHRCDSATFSWEKQCPICQTTPDIDHESK